MREVKETTVRYVSESGRCYSTKFEALFDEYKDTLREAQLHISEAGRWPSTNCFDRDRHHAEVDRLLTKARVQLVDVRKAWPS